MAAPRRAPTPLRSSTASSPLEAMIASKQAHIEELVTQTRTLEHTITKLQAALSEEQARGQDTVAALQKRWKAERAEWRDGCETLQAAHRIAHLRTAVELDRERMSVLKEREQLRYERLARLQRDFRLVTFQVRETDLEERIAALEAELEQAVQAGDYEKSVLMEKVDGKVTTLETRCEELAAELRESAENLADALEEKSKAEDALSRLKTEHNAFVVSSKKTESTLERTALQLDGLKSTHAELEKKYSEAEHNVAELRRQLEKWQKLESREGEEMDTLRRQRTELAVQATTLETRVKELEEQVNDSESVNEALKEKMKKKAEDFREAIAEWEKAFNDAQEAQEGAEAEAEKLEQKLETAREENKSLKVQLAAKVKQAPIEVESERERSSKPAKKKQRKRPSPVHELPSSSENEVEEVEEVVMAHSPPPQSKVNGRSKLLKTQNAASMSPKHAKRHKDNDHDGEIEEIEPPKKAKKQSKETAKSQSKTNEGRNGDEQEGGRAGGSKAKKKPNPRDQDDEDEAEIMEKKKPDKGDKRKAGILSEEEVEEVKAPKKRGRNKAFDDDDGEHAGRKPQSKSKTSAAANSPSKDTRKPPDRAKSRQPRQDDSGDDVVVLGDGTPKNKKRRLNVFPSNANPPMKFDWNPIVTTGDGSLNIPTELSPVKESGAVPPRSSVFRAIGSFIGSHGSRR